MDPPILNKTTADDQSERRKVDFSHLNPNLDIVSSAAPRQVNVQQLRQHINASGGDHDRLYVNFFTANTMASATKNATAN
eukprot:gene230-3608_t